MHKIKKTLYIGDLKIEVNKFYKILWNHKSGGWPEEIGRVSSINFEDEYVSFDMSKEFKSIKEIIYLKKIRSIKEVKK